MQAAQVAVEAGAKRLYSTTSVLAFSQKISANLRKTLSVFEKRPCGQRLGGSGNLAVTESDKYAY